MQKLHPLIEALVTSFYGGGSLDKQIEAFLKDFENATGYRIDIQNPDAGIFWFVKKKWGLPFDALIHFVDLKETLKKKKYKNLKKDSIGILIGSVIIQGLRLLEKNLNFKPSVDYKAICLDAKDEASKFRERYGSSQSPKPSPFGVRAEPLQSLSAPLYRLREPHLALFFCSPHHRLNL